MLINHYHTVINLFAYTGESMFKLLCCKLQSGIKHFRYGSTVTEGLLIKLHLRRSFKVNVEIFFV